MKENHPGFPSFLYRVHPDERDHQPYEHQEDEHLDAEGHADEPPGSPGARPAPLAIGGVRDQLRPARIARDLLHTSSMPRAEISRGRSGWR